MSDKSHREVILDILSELTAIPAKEIKLSDNLYGDLGMDSVASLEMIGMLDETFHIEIELEEAQAIQTVQAVMDLADQRLSGVA